MEVIARKKGSLFGRYILLAILGVALCTISIVFMVKWFEGPELIFLAVGALLIIIGVFGARRIQKTPEEIITYDGEKLYFADGLECSPREITNVTYKQDRSMGRYSHYQYSWGSVTVTVNGVEHTFDNTADVVDVHDLLIELMLQSREKTND